MNSCLVILARSCGFAVETLDRVFGSEKTDTDAFSGSIRTENLANNVAHVVGTMSIVCTDVALASLFDRNVYYLLKKNHFGEAPRLAFMFFLWQTNVL